MKIWIVDAFSSVPFNGNPAAVCLVDEFLPKEVMQKIASEMNFSETAFVQQIAKNHYHIRWFTPNSEAPLCGHATIAATHILFQESRQLESDTIKYKSLSGDLIVTKTDDWINLNFPYYEVHAIPFNDEIKKIVNINPIFTGFSENCIFMEYNSPDQIYSIKPNLEVLSRYDCRALIVTSIDKQYDFISRYFAPKVGINEDPVCASAHCRLIPYWSKRLNKLDMIAYQASARGGIIKCKNLGNRVLISGKAVTVLEGNLNILNIKELEYVA